MEPQSMNWVEESNELTMPSVGRKRRRPKRKEFVGWGSKQLIGFLNSIGKSTEEQVSQNDATSIINQYIIDNKLINPAKKKRVLCDAKLQVLFGRKTIARIKVCDLLDTHYADNELDCDSEFSSSDEREEDKNADHKAKKDLTFEEEALKRKKASEPPPNSPAAIVPENIKAVFLKRSLVQELLKDPDTFESKVLGSYVRVKADRCDYKQKNSHVLQLVTGIVKDTAGAGAAADVCLEIAEMWKRIKITELSEVSFSQEECEDLLRRMKEDYLKQPTVGELQEKVQVLHEDITKHWLPREIDRLECLMDRANEKGWRGEYFAHRDKMKLLQTPAEQARLLEMVPQVIAEELKLDPVPENTKDCPKKATTESPTVIDWVISNDQPANGGAETSRGANLQAQELETPKDEAETSIQLLSLEDEAPIDEADTSIQLQSPRVNGDSDEKESIIEADTNGNILSFDLNEMNTGLGSSPKQAEGIELNQSLHMNEMNKRAGSSGKTAEVIELSDDEEDNSLEGKVWHYMDPMNEVQGPFPLTLLKRWRDLGYFPPDFKVWKSGQSQKQEVPLKELLLQMFPH